MEKPQIRPLSPEEQKHIWCAIEEVKQRLGWAQISSPARNWWNRFESHNIAQPELMLCLLQEISQRDATMEEFFHCYSYSETESIQDNLSVLDFARARFSGKRPLVAADFIAIPIGIVPAEDKPYERAIPTYASLSWERSFPKEEWLSRTAPLRAIHEKDLDAAIIQRERDGDLGRAPFECAAMWIDFRNAHKSIEMKIRLVDLLSEMQACAVSIKEIAWAYAHTELNKFSEVLELLKDLKRFTGKKELKVEDFADVARAGGLFQWLKAV